MKQQRQLDLSYWTSNAVENKRGHVRQAALDNLRGPVYPRASGNWRNIEHVFVQTQRTTNQILCDFKLAPPEETMRVAVGQHGPGIGTVVVVVVVVVVVASLLSV